MKKLKKPLFIASIIFILAACSNEKDHAIHEEKQEINGEEQVKEYHPEGNRIEVTAPHHTNPHATDNLLHLNTKNVTRLASDDPIELSILTSQMIWPATHERNQPGTVILAPIEEWQIALASLNLVHHPNDGPLLFTVNGEISESIVNEIKRLQPKGNANGTQIMVMGDMNMESLQKLADYELTVINTSNSAEFAKEIDALYAELTNQLPTSLIIGSMDEEAKTYTIPAGSWISHMDEPLLYVTSNEIPQATIEALEKRNGDANIYVLGSEKVVSEQVVQELNNYGMVTRIAGNDPASLSIEFAKFKDPLTNFGWGIQQPGHGLMIASTKEPELAITAAPFAHLGKHAPMIWLNEGELTEEWYTYFSLLKPTFEVEPTEGPYNHAYIVGTLELVSFLTQGIIDDSLEIVSENGEGHGDHGGHGNH